MLTMTAFVFFVVTPLIYTLAKTFFVEDSFINNVRLLDKELFFLLAKSIILASVIALFSTITGTGLALLLYKTNIRFRSFFKIALLLPLFIPPYILAVAWKDAFFVFFNDTSLISSYFGVILVLTTVFTPLSMLITGSALSNIDSQLEDACLLISDYRSLIFKIILPLIRPAIITSFVLVFLFSISEFSVPAFLGVNVFTTEIFTQFSAFYNHSLAMLQSTLLILICILLLFSEKRYIADAPFLSMGSKGAGNSCYDMKKGKILGLLFLPGWFSLSVLVPFTTLFVQSFADGTTRFIQAFELLVPAFVTSIGLAFAGAVLIVLTGFSAAYYQSHSRQGKVINFLLLIMFAIPSTVYGISLIQFYNHPVFRFIYSSYAILLIGYTGKFSFIAAKLTGNAIKQIPNSFDEAAQIAGISSSMRKRKILIPLIMQSLFAAFVISFIFSLGELGTSIMLYPPGTEMMPVKVFTIMANAPQSLVSAMTMIVLSITLLIITAFYFMMKPFTKKYRYALHKT